MARRVAVGRIKGRCSFELSRDGGARGIEGAAREDGERAREREREWSSGPRGRGRQGEEAGMPYSGWLEWNRRAGG